MCTVIVFRSVFAFSPLVVAANRDEKYDRPSALPRLWPGGIWAPVDLEAGGTWIAVSERGLFAAVLNGTGFRLSAGRVTRGSLPLAALEARSAKEAAGRLSRIDGRSYNGFRLVIADAREAFMIRGDGMGVRADPLDGRLHVLTDRGVDDDRCARTRRIRELYRSHARHVLPSPSSLGPMLSFHGEDGRTYDGACVHSPGGEHGTRASTVIRMDDRDGLFELWHREGPACDGRFDSPQYVPIS